MLIFPANENDTKEFPNTVCTDWEVHKVEKCCIRRINISQGVTAAGVCLTATSPQDISTNDETNKDNRRALQLVW